MIKQREPKAMNKFETAKYSSWKGSKSWTKAKKIQSRGNSNPKPKPKAKRTQSNLNLSIAKANPIELRVKVYFGKTHSLFGPTLAKPKHYFSFDNSLLYSVVFLPEPVLVTCFTLDRLVKANDVLMAKNMP